MPPDNIFYKGAFYVGNVIDYSIAYIFKRTVNTIIIFR